MSNMHNIPITIAGILIEVTSPLSAAELGIEGLLGPFLALDEPEKPQDRVALRWEESENMPAPCGELIFDPGSLWRIYRAGKEYYAAICYPDGRQCVLRANATWDEVTLTEQRSGLNWQSLLNTSAGELLLHTRILLTNGLVFHAACIDDNGRSIVIVGHSGAGKSTQANFWKQVPGAIVINEDRIAVRSSESSAMCYGTPWGGPANTKHNHSAPLSAFILLEHAAENEIQRLSPSAAAPLLLSCAFLPYWDGALMQRAMANLNALLERVPVYLLRCRPEPAIVPLVRSVL